MVDWLPDFDDLPRLEDSDLRHSWDVWDRSGPQGTLNLLTDRTRLEALATVREGRCINLNLPVGEPSPPLYGRKPVEHRVFERNRNMIEDELTYVDPQASSQWDSLRHIRAKQYGFYGGVQAWESEEARRLGIDSWLEVGIVVRAVLADLPLLWEQRGWHVDPFDEIAITAADVAELTVQRDNPLRSGDLLVVRTGWLQRWRHAEVEERPTGPMPRGAGLDASVEMARFLWDSRCFGVATDNPAVEVLPGDPAVGSLHRRLIPCLGMPLGELWDLESVAAWANSSGRSTFCVVSVPLAVPGGVASTANAMALV